MQASIRANAMAPKAGPTQPITLPMLLALQVHSWSARSVSVAAGRGRAIRRARRRGFRPAARGSRAALL